MDTYILASSGVLRSLGLTEIHSYFQRRGSRELMTLENRGQGQCVQGNCDMGTIYGACFQSLIPMTSVDGNMPSDFLEVAFSPTKIFDDKLFGWTNFLGLALSGLLESSRWTGLLLELVTGMEHVQPLDQQPSAGLFWTSLEHCHNTPNSPASPVSLHQYSLFAVPY